MNKGLRCIYCSNFRFSLSLLSSFSLFQNLNPSTSPSPLLVFQCPTMAHTLLMSLLSLSLSLSLFLHLSFTSSLSRSSFFLCFSFSLFFFVFVFSFFFSLSLSLSLPPPSIYQSLHMTRLNTGTESAESPPPSPPKPHFLSLPLSLIVSLSPPGSCFVLGPHGSVNNCVFVVPSWNMLKMFGFLVPNGNMCIFIV